VCQPVSLSVTRLRCAKTAEVIEVLFIVETLGHRPIVLDYDVVPYDTHIHVGYIECTRPRKAVTKSMAVISAKCG